MSGQPAPGSNPILTFDVTDLEISEPGLPPSVVIPAGTAFNVNVEFEFDGAIAPALMGLAVPMSVYLRYESLGAGPEGSFGPVNVPTVAGTLDYTGTVNVPAGNPLTPGSYRLVGAVNWAGSPVAGFIDSTILEII
jgi:hypothetical protein